MPHFQAKAHALAQLSSLHVLLTGLQHFRYGRFGAGSQCPRALKSLMHVLSSFIILYRLGSSWIMLYHLTSSQIIPNNLISSDANFRFHFVEFSSISTAFQVPIVTVISFNFQNTPMAFLESQDHFSSADGDGSFGPPCASETFGGHQCRPDIGVLHASDPWKGHSCETMLRRAIMKCSMKEVYKWSLRLATI